jgi:hypothetical protein
MMSEMKIELPKQLIEDTIRAEMVRQIPADKRDKLIESVIRSALSQEVDRYSNRTVFQDEVSKMIREEAIAIFRAWLDENKTKIKDALFKYLNAAPQERLTEFCEKLVDNIESYGIKIELNLDKKER